MKKMILASSSPRRRELMALTGLEFEVLASNVNEDISADSPEELVSELSALKCRGSAQIAGAGCIVIGADTIVVFEGEILGKPKDGTDAVRMLSELSGNTHSVYTGVTVIDTDTLREITFCEKTDVTMFELSSEVIRKYVESEEPMDKAGAYAIQGKGALFIEKINGDFYTVVGLPVARLMKVLKENFLI